MKFQRSSATFIYFGLFSGFICLFVCVCVGVCFFFVLFCFVVVVVIFCFVLFFTTSNWGILNNATNAPQVRSIMDKYEHKNVKEIRVSDPFFPVMYISVHLSSSTSDTANTRINLSIFAYNHQPCAWKNQENMVNGQNTENHIKTENSWKTGF